MKRIFALSVLLLALMVPAVAHAESASQAVTAAASKLPEPNTEEQAKINQASLAPSVKKAIKAGEAKVLFETKDPDIIYDLAKYDNKAFHTTVEVTGEHRNHKKPKKPKHGETGSAEPTSKGEAPEAIEDGFRKTPFGAARTASVHHGPVATTAGCWGNWPADTYYNWFEGYVFSWTFVRAVGWCGSWGYYGQPEWAIWWYPGAEFVSWQWHPVFCAAGLETDYSWDGSRSWIHMYSRHAVGVTYAWGCLLYWNEKAQVRIAGNGYWDTYNDFGF